MALDVYVRQAAMPWRRRCASEPARSPTRRSSSTGTRGACRPRSGSHWYAERFSTVEVDSTFYRVPSESRWCRAGPTGRRPGSSMHIKAFGVMTRHPVRLEQLPPELRERMPADARGRVDRPSREPRARSSSAEFLAALEPLRAGRASSGGILFQMPPYVVRKRAVVRLPRVGARPARRRRDARRVPPPLVVRRGPPRRAARAGSRSGGMSYVTVDAPRLEARERARRRSSRRRRRSPTSASTAATPRPGTSRGGGAAAALRLPLRRGGARASGSSRCASSRARPRRPTRSSTTTTRRRRRAGPGGRRAPAPAARRAGRPVG